MFQVSLRRWAGGSHAKAWRGELSTFGGEISHFDGFLLVKSPLAITGRIMVTGEDHHFVEKYFFYPHQ